MNPLLVSGFGTTISVEKRKLIIDNKKNGEHIEFNPHMIDYDSIIIDGHTGNISFEAIRWLTKHDIPITMLNWNGNMLATINPKENNMGKLRVKQYEKYLDPKARYNIAYNLVKTKIQTSHNLLKELSKYYDVLDSKDIEKAFSDESNAFLTYNNPSDYDVNKVMVYEAKVAKDYWDRLTLVFNQLYPEFNFHGRRNKSNSWNMNAADEINALLNYGYAILEAQARRTINAVGLDPAVGYLHEVKSGNTPLVYDCQELYRWLIDLSVIEILEEKKIKKSDFIVTESYNLRLKEQTARTLIEHIKINFNRKAKYKTQNSTYANIFLDNVQTLSNHIIERQKDIQLDIPNYQIQRNDDLKIRESIMAITPEERKRLGINKSTLWQIQKNIKDGKRIKIYQKIKEKI